MKTEAELAQWLDECLERMRRGEDLETVLRQYPQAAEQLRSLLELSQGLGALPEPDYSLAGAMKTLARSISRFQEEQAAATLRWYSFWRLPWLVRAAPLLLVLLLFGWGIGTASLNAVPGDLLYPIKLFTERAKFYLALNPENRAELRIVFSEERLKEAVEKLNRGQGLDTGLLNEMLEEARQAVTASATLPPPQRTLLATRAAHASEFQREILDRLKDRVPPPQRKTVIRYRDMCRERAAWMRELPELSAPAASAGQSREPSRRWRERCPDWR